MITLRNLVKTIRHEAHTVEIIRDITFEIPDRQFTAIMGPSGSGKSTLLGLMAGLDWPTSGQIQIDGVDITQLNEDQMAALRGRKLGFVFQAYHLVPTLTAIEKVMLPMEMLGDERDGAFPRAEHLLKSVGLQDRSAHYPTQLSGGEQQRVALARAFMMRPSILFADKPTGNLDSSNGKHVLELLWELNKTEGTTLILVTHDETLAARADRRIVLSDGRIVWTRGTRNDLQSQQASLCPADVVAGNPGSGRKVRVSCRCDCVGTGALTAVTGFNASVRHTLSREARSLMARYFRASAVRPPQSDLRTLEEPSPRGSRRRTSQKRSAWRPRATTFPFSISVKGADLKRYPFYGDLKLDPANAQLDDKSVAVSDDLLLRLGIDLGDSIRVGRSEFRVAARVASEPDRMTTGFTLGPRVLFTREGLAGTGIITDIGRVTERVLLKLPENQDLPALRARLNPPSESGRTSRTIRRQSLANSCTRSFHAISEHGKPDRADCRGLGVGATMQSHLRQKMTNIAFMKCIGGRSEHILYIYLAQALWLGILGSVLGAILGAFAQSVFARLIANYFDVQVTLIWPVAAMLQGIVAGLATAALFSLPPLLAIRAVRPSTLLQRAFAGESRQHGTPQAGSRPERPLRAFGESQCGSANHCFMRPCSPEASIAAIFILGLIGALLLRVDETAVQS